MMARWRGAEQQRGFSSSCPESDDCTGRVGEGTGGRKGMRLSCQSRRVDEGGGGGSVALQKKSFSSLSCTHVESGTGCQRCCIVPSAYFQTICDKFTN